MPEPLPDELASALRASAGRRGHFGEPVIFASETGSTNDMALSLAERGAAEGTTCVALAQRQGRGRLGRVWFSPPGAGLYASVVCRTEPAIPFLTLAGGVAVAEGIRRATGLPVTIKWPNDIVAGHVHEASRRKLAGILAEGPSTAGALQYVVLGFGINVRPAAYPLQIAARATSLEAELGREVDAGLVLAEVLAALNEQVHALSAGSSRLVLDRWRELAPSAVGARVEWTTGGTTHRGTTSGIDETGALLVRERDTLRRIVAGELTWV